MVLGTWYKCCLWYWGQCIGYLKRFIWYLGKCLWQFGPFILILVWCFWHIFDMEVVFFYVLDWFLHCFCALYLLQPAKAFVRSWTPHLLGIFIFFVLPTIVSSCDDAMHISLLKQIIFLSFKSIHFFGLVYFMFWWWRGLVFSS